MARVSIGQRPGFAVRVPRFPPTSSWCRSTLSNCLNYDSARRECVRVLVWEVAREENLGKARSRGSRLDADP